MEVNDLLIFAPLDVSVDFQRGPKLSPDCTPKFAVSYKARGYVPRKEIYQIRLAGFKLFEGIAGNQG